MDKIKKGRRVGEFSVKFYVVLSNQGATLDLSTSRENHGHSLSNVRFFPFLINQLPLFLI